MAKRKHNKISLIAQNVSKHQSSSKNLHTPTNIKQQTDAFKLLMESRNKNIENYSLCGSVNENKETDEICRTASTDKKYLKENKNLPSFDVLEKEVCLGRKKTNFEKELKNNTSNRVKLPNKLISKNKIKHDKRKRKLSLKKVNSNESLLMENGVKAIESRRELIKEISETYKDVSSYEDQEIFNCTSTSRDKKENMLYYFKKIESSSRVDEVKSINFNPVSKLKKSKHKAKPKVKGEFLRVNKKGCLVLNGHNEDSDSFNENEAVRQLSVSNQSDCILQCSEPANRKRKWKKNCPERNIDDNSVLDESETKRDPRPKRQVKKPLRYVDDLFLSSSDEEYLSFIQKRKKGNRKTNESKNEEKSNIVILDNMPKEKTKQKYNKSDVTNQHKKKLKNKEENDIAISDNLPMEKTIKKINSSDVNSQSKKPTKLAPIFNPKAQVQLTTEEMHAKQKFLHSGIPEQLKKMIFQQKKQEKEFKNDFPVVVHVQQKNNISVITSEIHFDYFDDNCTIETNYLEGKKDFLKTMISLIDVSQEHIIVNKEKPSEVLKGMKEAYPEFPVYRTYKLLKNRSKDCGNSCSNDSSINSQCLTWTDKYKATSTSNFVGNIKVIKELKKWLKCWTENEIETRKNLTNSSDSSDFYDSDIEDMDNMKLSNNLLVLSGPTGSGKTSSIYAVASELAIKVIEVNVSSKRTGKLMLQNLQEATQSHKVNRANNIFERNQNMSYLAKEYKSKGKTKHSKKASSVISNDSGTVSQDFSQENARTCMSLILIDDADIVFEEDDGFTSAISQLVHSSKRPVVLTTSTTNCAHLQRFLQYGKVLCLKSYLPKRLGTWLDIMGLVDSGFCGPGLGSKFLGIFNGDIRKSINHLQFYLTTQKQMSSDLIFQKRNKDHGPKLFTHRKGQANPILFVEAISNNVINKQQNVGPIDLFSLWWSVPNLLHQIFKPDDAITSMKETELIANLMETISVADYFNHKIKQDCKSSLTSQPWKLFESDCVSELESLDTFLSSCERNDAIVREIVTKSVTDCQKSLFIEEKSRLHLPEIKDYQEKNRVASRHMELTSLLNPATTLDRRALALDCWSACRTLCRVEKNKTHVISKRHNRYCHYLKSLNVSCENDSLDKLGESLSPFLK